MKICVLQDEGGPKEHGHGHGIGVGHFESLRNLPYMAEGWQPSHQLSHPVPHHPQPLHPQAHNLLQERNWPSAFAPTQRYAFASVSLADFLCLFNRHSTATPLSETIDFLSCMFRIDEYH